MQWSKHEAHLLLQTRLKTLRHALGTVFKHWYPDMEVEDSLNAIIPSISMFSNHHSCCLCYVNVLILISFADPWR
jgi:hypothetical protein